MSNNFPSLADCSVVGVSYSFINYDLDTFPSTLDGGRLRMGALDDGGGTWQFVWQFQTSYDGDGNLAVDYGDFDQDDVESTLISAFDGFRTAVGGTISDGWNEFEILREWTFLTNSNTSGLGNIMATDRMSYTPS